MGVGVFLWAMQTEDHWLPVDISQHGQVIDNLFYSIMYLTGVIFIGTGGALFWFMWKYNVESNAENVKFLHGSHTLEIVWSILPAATLLFLAIYQMNAWADAKLLRPMIGDRPKPPLAEVRGRQFEWRIHYAGDDGVVGTEDDVHTVNELHVPLGEEVVLKIKSEDVLHSFFLPNCRVKQDVVPGMQQYVWFQAQKEGEFDIVCAELCGWGHYKMKGRLTVETRTRFEQWLRETRAAQQLASFVPQGEETDE
jgi:cytochrome c oxidase subunit 2